MTIKKTAKNRYPGRQKLQIFGKSRKKPKKYTTLHNIIPACLFVTCNNSNIYKTKAGITH